MIQINFKKNNGFSPLELILYIALFISLSLVVINSMIVMVRAFRETSINTEIIQGVSIIERISREVRSSYSINSISSNSLILNTKDDSNNDKTVQFVTSGNNIRLLENGSFVGNLNTPNLNVSGLSFTQITTVKGTAVKIFFTVTSNRNGASRTENFYDTVVLRGDY